MEKSEFRVAGNVSFLNNYGDFVGGALVTDRCNVVVTGVASFAYNAGYNGGGILAHK